MPLITLSFHATLNHFTQKSLRNVYTICLSLRPHLKSSECSVAWTFLLGNFSEPIFINVAQWLSLFFRFIIAVIRPRMIAITNTISTHRLESRTFRNKVWPLKFRFTNTFLDLFPILNIKLHEFCQLFRLEHISIIMGTLSQLFTNFA